MHTVRCGFDDIPTVRFGAVLINRESYGRFGAVIYPTVRFGAVFQHHTYGAVRCGFQECKNPTVNRTEPHRTERKNRTVKNPAY